MSTSAAVRIVGAIVRAWVALYTTGLPAGVAASRRAVVASDLWEHTNDPDAHGGLARALLSRWLRGVPGDLAWRWSAPRSSLVQAGSAFEGEGRSAMTDRSIKPWFYSGVTGVAWALVLVLAIAPTRHSLAYSGALLLIVSLAGWLIEARESASVDEDAAPGPSAWPSSLAVGVGATGAGIVFDGGRLGLALAVPWALFAAKAWLGSLRAPLRSPDAPPVAVPGRVLDLRAASGYAIAVERTAGRHLSRRSLLQTSLWLALGSTLAATVGSMLDYLWARNAEAFGGVVDAGAVERFAPGTKTKIPEGRFWLVSLTAEQGGPGYLALWQKCPHLGCVVPWQENFSFADPDTGATRKGWFRCPCHQSTYNDAGVRVFGPAPRSMDRMAVAVNAQTGRVEVDTGRISKGTPDNAAHAVPSPPA